MPTLKLKKEDILNILHAFNNDIPQYLIKNPGAEINTRFSFLINYNKNVFEPIIQAIKNTISEAAKSKTPDPEYELYEIERKSMLEKYSERKDETGYKIAKENVEKLNAELIIIDAKYKNALDRRAKEEEEINVLLKEDIDVTICKTSFNNFPKWLNMQQLKILRPFALETDEEIMNLIAS